MFSHLQHSFHALSDQLETITAIFTQLQQKLHENPTNWDVDVIMGNGHKTGGKTAKKIRILLISAPKLSL